MTSETGSTDPEFATPGIGLILKAAGLRLCGPRRGAHRVRLPSSRSATRERCPSPSSPTPTSPPSSRRRSSRSTSTVAGGQRSDPERDQAAPDGREHSRPRARLRPLQVDPRVRSPRIDGRVHRRRPTRRRSTLGTAPPRTTRCSTPSLGRRRTSRGRCSSYKCRLVSANEQTVEADSSRLLSGLSAIGAVAGWAYRSKSLCMTPVLYS